MMTNEELKVLSEGAKTRLEMTLGFYSPTAGRAVSAETAEATVGNGVHAAT